MGNKKSFILHLDSLSILDDLNFEQKGILFDAIHKYHLGIEVELDFAMKLAFAPFKNQFKRDIESWGASAVNNSVSGMLGNLKRWHPELYNKVINKELDINEAMDIIADVANHRELSPPDEIIAPNRENREASRMSQTSLVSVSVSDNVSDSVNASVNGKKKVSASKSPSFDFRGFLIQNGGFENLVNDWINVRKQKKGAQTETAARNFLDEVAKSGLTINDALKICVVKNWVGFSHKWDFERPQTQKTYLGW